MAVVNCYLVGNYLWTVESKRVSNLMEDDNNEINNTSVHKAIKLAVNLH